MTALTTAYVAVRPDMRQFGPELKSGLRKVDATKSGKESGRKFGGAFGGTVKGMLGGAAILGALTSAIGFLKSANAEARESQKVGATTTQIIKSTGGAAKITAGQVGALATAISNKTGRDDEAIQSGANLLLTFKNVRNEVGKGSNIFDRATAAAVDLSAAGFGSVSNASKMLGKALNDPIAGMSALSRAGVTFSAQQKEQIRVLVQSGNVLGAQKLIMKEVESQVGGVAAASATATEKMSVAFNNFKEQVGTALLPVIDGFADIVTRHVIPALSRFVSWLAVKIPAAFNQLRAAFSGGGGGGIFTGIADQLRGLFAVVGPIVREIVGVLIGQFMKMRPQIMSVWTSVKEIIVGVMFIIKEVIQAVTAIISAIWKVRGEEIKRIVGGTFSAIFKTIAGVMKAIAGVIKLFVALIKGDWRGAWNAIKQIFSGVWAAIKAILTGYLRIVDSMFGSHFATVKARWVAFWSGVKTTTASAIDAVHTKIRTVLDRIRGAFQTAKDNIGRVWSGVKGVVSAPIEWVKNNVYNRPLVPVWNRVAGLVNGPKLSTFAKGGIDDSYGIRPGYTPGRDTHLIAVGGGEPVLRPEAGRALGRGWVDGVNRSARTGGVSGVQSFLAGGGQGFAGGGIVGWIKNSISGAGSAIAGLAGKMKDWALGGLRDAAAKVLSPLRAVIRSQLSGSGVRTTAGGIANKALDLILDKIKSSDAAASAAGLGGGGPVAGGSYAKALTFARAQNGKPYRYPMVGPGSYDCSGFVGTVHNVILGQKNPYHRRYSTGMFLGGPHTRGGLTRDKVSPFRVGIIPTGQNGGRIGHMAATLNGVNIESAGGVGVRIGGRARGWNSGLFKYHYGLARGGMVGDLAFDTLDPRGQRFDPASRALIDMLYGSRALASGAIVRGGRGGVLAHIGEGARDEIVAPLPRQWQAGRGSNNKAASSRPITIVLDLGDGVAQRVQGILDENDEFRAGVGRMR